MPVYSLGSRTPKIHPDAYVHPDAVVIGDVTIGSLSSIWPSAVLRGDYGTIVIGERTSIQDGAVVHAVSEFPTLVGPFNVVDARVTVSGSAVGCARSRSTRAPRARGAEDWANTGQPVV